MTMGKRYRIKKRFYVFVVLLLVALILLCMGVHGLLQDGSASGGDIPKLQKDFDGMQSLPKGYTDPAEKKGSLKTLEYTVSLNDDQGTELAKSATVYLPYGYDEGKQYDIFYLLHGAGGDDKLYLDYHGTPSKTKNLFDHMISDEKIKPFIVVTPTYSEEYGDYYQMLDGMASELVEYLIPAVENKYRTYAETTDAEGLTDSREHRAVGGFSMGACTTWRTLRSYSQYFAYYLPMSMPMYYSDNGYVQSESAYCAKLIHDGVQNAGEKKNYIFAASGSEDWMNEATAMQVEDLCDYDAFTYTEKGFSDGNVMFYSWKNHGHSFREAKEYLYNGLIRFYRDSR